MKIILTVIIGLIPIVFGLPTFPQRDNFMEHDGQTISKKYRPSEDCKSRCLCPNNSDLVCGSDKITYRNPCHLKCSICTHPGVQYAHHGPCYQTRPDKKNTTSDDIEVETHHKNEKEMHLLDPFSDKIVELEEHKISKREVDDDSQRTLRLLRDILKQESDRIETQNDDLFLSKDFETEMENVDRSDDENEARGMNSMPNIINAMHNLRKANEDLLLAKSARKTVIHELDKLAFKLKGINEVNPVNDKTNVRSKNSIDMHQNDDSKNSIYDKRFNIFDLFNMNKYALEPTKSTPNSSDENESEKDNTNVNERHDAVTESTIELESKKDTTINHTEDNTETNEENNADNNETIKNSENEQLQFIDTLDTTYEFPSSNNEDNGNTDTHSADLDSDTTEINFTGTNIESDNHENDETLHITDENQDKLQTEDGENTRYTENDSENTAVSYEIYDHKNRVGSSNTENAEESNKVHMMEGEVTQETEISPGIEYHEPTNTNSIEKHYDSASGDMFNSNEISTKKYVQKTSKDETYDTILNDSSFSETSNKNQETTHQTDSPDLKDSTEITSERSTTTLNDIKTKKTSNATLTTSDMETSSKVNEVEVSEGSPIGENVNDFPLNSIDITNPVREENNEDNDSSSKPIETKEDIDRIFVGDQTMNSPHYLNFMDKPIQII